MTERAIAQAWRQRGGADFLDVTDIAALTGMSRARAKALMVDVEGCVFGEKGRHEWIKYHISDVAAALVARGQSRKR